MSGRPFTAEQNDWIREHYREYGKHHIAEAFNEKFNDHRGMETLWSKVRRWGLTGNGADYKAEMCKKHFSVPIGTEHKQPNGYTLVKYKDDKNGRSKNWKTKQDWLWEQNYGEIPKGCMVMFLDNDPSNFDLNNLACVPSGRMAMLAKKNWKTNNAELTKAALAWCDLYALTKGSILPEGYQDEALCVFSSEKIR